MKAKVFVIGMGLFSSLGFSKTIFLPERQFDTCFRPFENCEGKFVEFLSMAKSSINMQIFNLNSDAIVEALKQKLEEGVSVHILVDREKAENIPDYERLHKHGAKIRYGVQEGKMHNKFTIIDNTMVQFGSSNYTQNSFEENQESMVYTSHKDLVAPFVNHFERTWKNGEKF